MQVYPHDEIIHKTTLPPPYQEHCWNFQLYLEGGVTLKHSSASSVDWKQVGTNVTCMFSVCTCAPHVLEPRHCARALPECTGSGRQREAMWSCPLLHQHRQEGVGQVEQRGAHWTTQTHVWVRSIVTSALASLPHSRSHVPALTLLLNPAPWVTFWSITIPACHGAAMIKNTVTRNVQRAKEKRNRVNLSGTAVVKQNNTDHSVRGRPP